MSVRRELPKRTADTTPLHAVVKGKDAGDRPWKEVSELISFSATGASFNLPRQCEAGTLVLLMIPIPTHLRCYDYDKEFYRVWGLVQHCAPILADDTSKFHVGVAFIGKNSPASYKKDSTQHYRITGVNGDGLWGVAELATAFQKRSHVRFWMPVDLYLALIDTKDGATGGERTVAENVSRSGAAVFTTLNVGIGDRVKFISEQYDFSGLAVVCNVQSGTDNRKRLHLRFVETTFPVETLMRKGVAIEQRV
jgi:hypothetical protein